MGKKHNNYDFQESIPESGVLIPLIIQSSIRLKDSIRLRFRPLIYYTVSVRVLFNGAIYNPERFLTILGTALAILGTILLGNKLIQDFAVQWKWYILSLLIFGSPFLILLMTRREAKDFVEIVTSDHVTTEELIKHTCFEVHRVVEYVNSKSGHDLLFAIRRMRNSIKIVAGLSDVLASRLNITRREVSDDILKFSVNTYLNRKVKIANMDIINKDSEHDAKRREKISTYSSNIEKHQVTIMKTALKFNKLIFMFQTRSVSGATQYFIRTLEQNLPKIVDHKQRRILINLQKAHRTGIAQHRSIGLTIVAYLNKNIDIDTCIQRIAFLSDKESFDECKLKEKLSFQSMRASIPDWPAEAKDAIYVQRIKMNQLFKGAMTAINNKRIKKEKSGELYIVVSSYSRAVRAAIRETFSSKNFEEAHIVICSNTKDDLSSKLFFHQLMHEHYSITEASEPDSFHGRVWRSGYSDLVSRFNKEKDHIVYISGCDHIEHCRIKDKLVAYKTEPTSILEIFSKVTDNEHDVILIGGEYKYDLDTLANRIEEKDKDLFQDVISLLPKKRRSGLHQWCKNSEMPNLQLISNYYPPKVYV